MIKTIGILGGGQLGRMLTEAAKLLGFEVIVIDPTPQCPAAQVGAEQIVAPYTDEKATRELARRSDVITIEFEHINAEVLKTLEGLPVHPAPATIALIQDKLKQTQALREEGLPVADFMEIERSTSFEELEGRLGVPFHLKARHGAFDGRGNRVVKDEASFKAAQKDFEGRSLYAEKHVEFKKELSVLIAKNIKGELLAYPVVETVHKDNICHMVYSPARVEEQIAYMAAECAKQAVRLLEGAGVYAVEMFVDERGEVYINEIAPRVHNSGHHTIEGNVTSQFEQHIRAVTGLPLGEVFCSVPATVMINILGERDGDVELEGLEKVLAIPQTYVHMYGKSPTKKQRKMGHITTCANEMSLAEYRAKAARKALSI